MKKKILALILAVSSVAVLSGCGKKDTAEITPETVKPVQYTDETAMPADTFYIVHKTKKSGNVYYPLLIANSSFSEAREDIAGADPSRIEWVNYNGDEGQIPTMRKGDSIIYKSSTSVPLEYTLEKFFDGGYTFGVAGLYQDESSKYRYTSVNNSGSGITQPTSNAIGFDSLEADSIYFASYKNGKKNIEIDPSNVSLSGTIKGLKKGKTYECDIRTGTEKMTANLTANIHYFSSAETYKFNNFEFITEHIAKIATPKYLTTGYYNLNGAGFFRYVADNKKVSELKAEDYNETIYTYDEENSINGTTNGYVFDSNNYLVKDVNGSTIDPEDYTYDGTDAAGSNAGTFKITDAKAVENTSSLADDNNLQYVDFTGIDINTNEVVGFRLISRNGAAPITLNINDNYYITYKTDTGDEIAVSDTYTKKVLSIKQSSAEAGQSSLDNVNADDNDDEYEGD